MAVSEPDRHELYQTLERVLGKGPSDTMMALLPPVGWADVATRSDLEALEGRLDLRFETVQSRMEAMEARILERIHQQVSSLYRTMIFAIVGAVATVGGLAFAAAQLV